MSDARGTTWRDADWWRARGPELLAAFATIVALGLGLYRIGRRPFWVDEATRSFISDLGWGRFFEVIGGTQEGWHPATYFMILKPWRLLGESEPALRVLSLAFAALTVPAFYLVARALTTRWTAALGALLLAGNAYFIQYAQDVSPYSMTVLLTCASFWLLMRAVQKRTRLAWAAYVVVAVLGVYTHLFFALVVMAQAAAVALIPRLREQGWRTPLVAFGGVGLSALPLVGRGLGAERTFLGWVDPVGPSTLERLMQALSGGTESTLVLYVLGGLLAAAWGIRQRQRRAPIIVLLLWALVPPLALFAVSTVRPLFVDRYLITVLPAVVLLTAIGFARLPAWAAAVFFTVTLVASSFGLAAWYTSPYENWRATAAYLSTHGTPRDLVVVWDRGNVRPLIYQAQRLGLVHSEPGLAEPPLRWDRNPYAGDGRGRSGLAKNFAQCELGRVWLVGAPPSLGRDGSRSHRSTVRILTRAYRPVAEHDFGEVTLRLYQRNDQRCPRVR